MVTTTAAALGGASCSVSGAATKEAGRGKKPFWAGDNAYPARKAFADRILPASIDSGFRAIELDGESCSVWCGSVIQGEDGRYHMFASAIPRGPGKSWVWDSVVVRAVSDTIDGTYKFAQVVLPRRGQSYWDGLMTHNPTIHKCGDTYLLFYTGTTYKDRSGSITEGWRNKRIGVATSKSVLGPWTRRDEPILPPRPGKWDSVITSNAAPCVHENGSVILVYKSTPSGYRPKGEFDLDLRIGVATADHYLGPYKRAKDDSILGLPGIKLDLEDPYIWKGRDGWYHMLVKVFHAGWVLIGEMDGGLHAVSRNGVDWQFAPNLRGYSRTVRWSNGTVTTQGRLERVQAFVKDGNATHLFVATRTTSSDGITGNVCLPLATETSSIQTSSAKLPAPTALYTAYNIWYEKPDAISSANYKTGKMLPGGTPVRSIQVKGSRIAFTTNDGGTYTIDFQARRHPGMTNDEFKDRMLIPRNFAEMTREMTALEVSCIRKGAIVPDLGKQAVAMVYGYPPEDHTPSVNSSVWRYPMSRARSEAIEFDTNGMTTRASAPLARSAQ
jgi:hypothetical protein